MSNNQETPVITGEQKQKQLEALQVDVDIIFAEAIANQVKTVDFAIEIWVNAMQEKAAYVAIASRMIHHSTNFQGDEMVRFLRYLADGTLDKNASIAQWSVNLINDGLIISNSLSLKQEN
ncbi:hypothetical protein [Microcoleus sp. D2_18a_D3]|uniref:hypothetical protein n=1 Tax=Microcoleus sp. D2_18a_D3 TaxID=3055330 RepID=UPI002FD0FDBC